MLRMLKMCNPEGYLSLPHKHKLYEPLRFYSEWLCLIFSGFSLFVVGDYEILLLSCLYWRQTVGKCHLMCWDSSFEHLLFYREEKAHHVHCRLVRYWYRFANSVQYSTTVCERDWTKIPSLFVFGQVCVCLCFAGWRRQREGEGLCISPTARLFWKCQSCECWCIVLFERNRV